MPNEFKVTRYSVDENTLDESINRDSTNYELVHITQRGNWIICIWQLK